MCEFVCGELVVRAPPSGKLSRILHDFDGESVRSIIAAGANLTGEEADELAKSVNGNANLTSLDVSRCAIDEGALRGILEALVSKSGESVQTLRIQGAPLTDALMLPFAQTALQNVRTLDASGVPLTSAGVLGRLFPCAETVSLRDSSVRGAGVDELIRTTSVRSLFLDGCFDFRYSGEVKAALKQRSRASPPVPLRLCVRGVKVTTEALDLLSFCSLPHNKKHFAVVHDLLQPGNDHDVQRVDRVNVQVRFNGGSAVDVGIEDVDATTAIMALCAEAIGELNAACASHERRKAPERARRRRAAYAAAFGPFSGSVQLFQLGTVSLYTTSKATAEQVYQSGDLAQELVGAPRAMHRLCLKVEAEIGR